MNRITRRPLATLLAIGSLTAFAPTPPTWAAVDFASFEGGFTSVCTLPEGPEGPEDGPYSCQHTATSIGCAGVTDTAVVTGSASCQAHLTSATTYGEATAPAPPARVWTCDNGAGSGSFTYRPSPADPAIILVVDLVKVGEQLVISGRRSLTGRTIVVRATIPAVCAAQTASPTGYSGTVTSA